MKRAVFRVDPARGGWIRTSIAPLNNDQEARFSFIDVTMFLALVVGGVAVARFLLAS
jgi:hypothetical protein